MDKKNIFLVVIIVLFFSLSAAYGLGDRNNEPPEQSSAPKVEASKIESPKVESSQAVAQKAKPKLKEMTKEEILVELKGDLADNEEVLNMVPELKAGKGADDKVFYTFKGTKLEDLSKEELDGLFTKTRQVIVRVRTEKIQRQLEIVSQAQKMQRIAVPPQPPRIPAQPPSPPRTPSKPSVPPSPNRR